MKFLLRGIAKAIGIVFMFLAFLQWVTFDYPDVNPFWPGAIFAPGMASQILNWGVVCILAVVGWGFFTLGKFKLSNSATDESD